MRPKHRQSGHIVAAIEAHARQMRHAPTPTEEMVWQALRGGKLGVVFRRQYRIGRYIADFAAPAIRLVVEVDGASHHGRERQDGRREQWLEERGWRVLTAALAAPPLCSSAPRSCSRSWT